MTEPRTLLIVLALAGCAESDHNITAKQLEEARVLCETHNGISKLNLPQPVDVYCADGFHVRLFGRD